MLACGFHFSPGDIALFYALLGGWLSSPLWAIGSLFIIALTNMSTRATFAHGTIWALYVVSGLTVATRGLNGMQGVAWAIPIFGVPILAISHFLVLVRTRRRIKLRMQEQTPPDQLV